MSSSPAVTVVAADDHPLFLQALSTAIEQTPELELLAIANDGAQALETIRERQPDVAILDMRMPKLDGREVLRGIREAGSATRVLFVSEYVGGELVLQALSAGGAGYVAKSATAAEICSAILTVSRGDSVLPTDIASQLAGTLRDRGPSGVRLTPREISVLEMMADGGTASAIADRLHLAVPTVKTHVQNIYAKLEVNDRGAAIAEAMRRGLVS